MMRRMMRKVKGIKEVERLERLDRLERLERSERLNGKGARHQTNRLAFSRPHGNKCVPRSRLEFAPAGPAPRTPLASAGRDN